MSVFEPAPPPLSFYVNKAPSITLDPNQIKKIKAYAAEKRQFALDNKFNELKISKKSGLEIMIQGFAAEAAFAKLYHLTFPPTINQLTHYDFILRGFTIDVKSTEIPYSRLFVHFLKALPHKTCDFYAFMIGTIPTFKFMGFATASNIFKPENIRNYQNLGDSYSIPIKALQPTMSAALRFKP